MTDAVRFHFDPLCPWCYQTSRWIRRLEESGDVALSWGIFSLELTNADDPDAVGTDARAAAALRTVVVVRDVEGEAAVGRFYAALGEAIHERGEAPDDPSVLQDALEAAGLPGALLDKACSDAATWERVKAEHHALVDRTRSFGVPTIVLDGGEGPAIFGPVISEVPDAETGRELWRHVSWLARYENFSELKRDRTTAPDLESVRRHAAKHRG
jgi:protein-disulfide isomerase-like protein with CxxC motif